jgi:hypothetical protein
VRLYWSYGLIWSFEPGTGAEPIWMMRNKNSTQYYEWCKKRDT